MTERVVAIAGGGAAGFFAAIACVEAAPDTRVIILEKGPHFLAKVKVSGGGRCNVTHAWNERMDPAQFYPRGHAALRSAFHRFGFADTRAWFEARGVRLKTERDGRVFPITDSSQTVIDCLLGAAKRGKVQLRAGCSVETVALAGSQFQLGLSGGETLSANRLLLCTGGCRSAAGGQLAVDLGHSLISPVPSLFAFNITEAWVRELPGISAEAEIALPDMGVRECGPVVLTHTGLSGPAVLRASAWAARDLHTTDYQTRLLIKWLPSETEGTLKRQLERRRLGQAARFVRSTPFPPLPARLWERLLEQAGIGTDTRWAMLGGGGQHRLIRQLLRTELHISGKSLNKEEFVTCGGVRLSEVDFKTMQSRIRPGLFLAGELLDIDAVTGGFNFQAAWTTGWLAGRAMASAP